MNPDYSDDDLRQRIRLLQRQNHHLQDQNAELQDAIDMICAAFLNNGAGLENAIQAAMKLQHRTGRGSDQIQTQPLGRRRNLEID